MDNSYRIARNLIHELFGLEKEWRDKRTGSLYSRGDKSKEGNLNLRIRQGKGRKFFLRINSGYRKWIEIPLYLGKKYRKKLEKELKRQDCCYSVEITRRDGRYFIHIILEEKVLNVHNAAALVIARTLEPG